PQGTAPHRHVCPLRMPFLQHSWVASAMKIPANDRYGPAPKVLVTGATGFIGRTLTQRLLERQHPVNVLSRRAAQGGVDQGECSAFTGDINDAALLRQACRGVDTVFHLAAYAHVNHHDVTLMRATNVEGTRSLLEAAVAEGVRRIVFFSSSLAAAEEARLSDYGRAKRDAEILLLEAAAAGRIEVCCLRPVNVYGLGLRGNLMTMIRLIHKGVFPPLPRPAASVRSEEHTSELQSREDLVCRLQLEKQ